MSYAERKNNPNHTFLMRLKYVDSFRRNSFKVKLHLFAANFIVLLKSEGL